MDVVILATRNAGKANEFARLLSGMGWRFETLFDHADVALPSENGKSYRENALAKARAAFEALGLPAIGDDSGLEVDALGGAPGLYSARYAEAGATDAANNEKLLRELLNTPDPHRTARFRCALAFVRGADDTLECEGSCEGNIVRAPRGASGFGYDPLFLPEGEALTFGELSEARKDSISHRARAALTLARAIHQVEGRRS